jgi:DNA helicase-2/ATP-dependent DNA helicase PcrA
MAYQDETEERPAEEALIDHPRLVEAALDKLTSTQYAAVTFGTGPLLILAGAGTGKTKCLTSRIAYAIGQQHIGPQHVLAITFTRKAAREMKHRLAGMMGPAANAMHIGTFHSTCIRILRDNAEYAGISAKFTVLSDDEQTKLVKTVVEEILGDKAKGVSAAQVRDALDEFRNGDGSKSPWQNLLDDRKASDTVQGIEYEETLTRILDAYEREKSDAEVLDFNDIIIKVIEIFEKHDDVRGYYRQMWRLVLVDEYQDTNTAQEKLVRLILNEQNNITVVGDDDQSVYSWRGAVIENILQFKDRYDGAQVIKLEENFRSTGRILDAANALIGRNSSRLGKTLYTSQDSGTTLSHMRFNDSMVEARHVVAQIKELTAAGANYGAIAVLGRYSTQFQSLQLPLAQARIPFTVTAGKKASETKDIQDVIAYYRFAKNRADDYALMRILDAKSRGVGPQKLRKIMSEARSRSIPMIEALKGLIDENEIKGKTAAGLTDLINFLEELGDDYQLGVSPGEIFAKVIAELDVDAQMQKEREKAEKKGDAREREKALNAVKNRLDRLDHLKIAIVSSPDLDDMVDSLALDPVEADDAKDGVWVGTVHAAKGLEFDHVILPGWSDGVFPSGRILRELKNADNELEAIARADLEEERRLAYVAITRGRLSVRITSIERFQEESDLPASRFIAEISPELAKVKKTWI